MSKRRMVVAGNWKMNGSQSLVSSMVSAVENAQVTQDVDVAIFPPAVYLSALSGIAPNGLHFGTQNCSQYEAGAYTGEVSLTMLSEFNADMVILGHSERRTIFNESNEEVAAKVARVAKQNLTPVLCIGESEQEREQDQTESVLASQLQSVLSIAGQDVLAQCIVAYEPIWAIGTGKTATPEMAQETHEFIRHWLRDNVGDVADKMRILYGGSVNAGNSHQLFQQPDIDGGLIGGASLKESDFVAICKSAKEQI